jgi:hypothetical protein
LFYLLSIPSCAVGVFSKPTGSLIPVVLFIYSLIFCREKEFKTRLFKGIRLTIPYLLLTCLFILMMLYSLGRFEGYSATAPTPWYFSVINFFLSLIYPTDFLKLNVFSTIYSALHQPTFEAVFSVILLAAVAVYLKIHSKDRVKLFLASWFLIFLLVFLIGGIIVNPWYMYLPSIPFAILCSLFLKESVETFNEHLLAKAVALPIVLMLVSVTVYSPLFADYPEPRIASNIIQGIFDQTLSASKYMPPGSKLYLINYPEYMMLTEKGFPYSIFLVSEGSIKALLDYSFPGRGLKSFSITSARLFSNSGEFQLGFRPEGNCYFVAENRNLKSASLYPSLPWLINDSGRDNVLMKYQRGVDSEWVMVSFPQGSWESTYLLVYNGNAVEVSKLGEYCR